MCEWSGVEAGMQAVLEGIAVGGLTAAAAREEGRMGRNARGQGIQHGRLQ